MFRLVMWLLVSLIMWELVQMQIATPGAAGIVVIVLLFVLFRRLLRFVLGVAMIFRALAG